MVQPDGTQMTIHMVQKRCDLHAGWLRQEYRHSYYLFNTYCFSMATMVMWMCLSIMFYVHCLSCLPCKSYMHYRTVILLDSVTSVSLFYRWSYWHQCTNWAHSFCVHMTKMHSIVSYLLQESWSTQMVQFSQKFMCTTQCLTMFPLNSSHYSSPICKFSSIYTISQCRDRITGVGPYHIILWFNGSPEDEGSLLLKCCVLCFLISVTMEKVLIHISDVSSIELVHNTATAGTSFQLTFHQSCILCITTTRESQTFSTQYHNFYSQLGVTSVPALGFACSKKV
jgi:hypothetical protein